ANQALAAAKAETDKLAQAVETQKAAVAKTEQDAAAAQQAIDAAKKTIADAKSQQEKSSKDLEADKKALAAAEEAKKKSEAEAAKRKQAFDTATLAQQRSQAAIPAHQTVIDLEARRQTALEETLKGLQGRLAQSVAPVTNLAFSGDQQQIAVSLANATVRVYRGSDGLPTAAFHGASAHDNVAGLIFTDQQTLVAFRASGLPTAWSLAPRWQLERTIGSLQQSPISDRVTALDFRPDGLTLAIGSGPPSRSGEVQIYSTSTGQLVRDFGPVHSDTVLSVRFSADGRSLASSAADKTVRLLDIASGQVIRSLEGHTHHVLSIAWNDDGQTIASASADQNIKVWNIETGEQRRTIGGFPKEITAITFVDKSNQVITSCADGQLRLHDTGNGKSLRSFNASGDFLFSLSVTPDGKTLVAGGHSGVVRAWTVADGKLVHQWE
ncbi:MAG: WD40 repeat domain-containing protein, partial [Pirellulales bacterium]|nr:WD40 repeat domain-containing protein [Pirellulales bacterium]